MTYVAYSAGKKLRSQGMSLRLTASSETSTVSGHFSASSVKSFIQEVSEQNSGVIDVLRYFVTWLMIGQLRPDGNFCERFLRDRWPTGLHNMVMSMLRILDNHNAGLVFMRTSWPDVFCGRDVDNTEVAGQRRAITEVGGDLQDRQPFAY